MIAPVGKHQIIQDAAVLIGEKAIALTTLCKTSHIDGHHRLKPRAKRGHIGLGPQDYLPHVTDIEQARRRACVEMFFHHASRILHRHFIARKGHHLSTKGNMQVVKTQSQQVGQTAPPYLAGITPASYEQANPCSAMPPLSLPRCGVPEIVIPSAGQ